MDGNNIFGFGFGTSLASVPVPPVSDKNFVFQQLVPSDTWIVPHNLGKKVAVDVTNNSNIGMGCVIEWNNDNEVTIYFSNPQVGWVYCN